MTETSPPPVPAPQIPKLPTTLPFEDEAGRARRDGCLKWGLVGCAGGSVVLIVALLFTLSHMREMMGTLLEKVGEEIAAAATADVTPAEKEHFRAALAAFSQKSQKGLIKPEAVGEWRRRATNAVADGRVTPDEMRSLTAWLETSGAAPPPAPVK
jgi:hypothetical protein